jgi:cellulase
LFASLLDNDHILPETLNPSISNMKSSIFAIALAGGAQLAAAHTTVWNVLVNGKDQGVGNKQGGYIDSPPNNNPVLDVTSKSIECNVAGVKASKSISAGDDIIASVC